MSNKILIILVVLSSILLSCSDDKSSFTNSKEAEIIKANKIVEKTAYKIAFLGEEKISKRIEYIDYFNESGNVIQEIKPHYDDQAFINKLYIEHPYDKRFVPNDLWNAVNWAGISDIPLNFTDTTNYEYNKKNELVKEQRIYYLDDVTHHFVHLEYEYDERGNQIKSCLYSDENPNNCNFFTYTYTDNNRIKTIKDSSSSLNSNTAKTVEYTYDEKGNLISDEWFKYKYDNMHNRIERTRISGLGNDEIDLSKYDNNNNLIQLVIGYKRKNNKIDSSLIYYYQYDKNQLLTEEKVKAKNTFIITITKYEYKKAN